MASSDQALRNLLLSYKNNHDAFSDIRAALQNFKDLHHQKKPFTYGNGQVKSLVCLEGTIPITYKSRTYNIPVIVWLHETHPTHAPLVYVQPTATMNIKPGPHVSPDGSVAMPYLNDWRQGHSDLTTLISVLCMVFGESPPVFSKPKNQPPAHPAAPSPVPAPTQPPYPVSGASTMPLPYPAAGGTGYPAQPPAYPPAPGYPANTSTVSATPQGYNPYGPPTQTPYPANTTASTIGGYPGMYGQGTGYGTGAPYPTAGSTSYPQPSAGGYPPASNINYPTTSNTSGYSNYTAPTYTNPAATVSQSPALDRQKSYGLSDDEIKQSLLSAAEDKMRRKLKDMFATHKAEMDVLRKTQEDLNAGKRKLETMSKTIDTETTECESTIAILSAKIPEIQSEIESSNSDQELPPEEAIETTAPIYKQLIQSFAEEQAIEDTLYILGDALRREVIGIEIYLKKVRDLSRKQFMLRALIQKCREKAGLSDVYS